MPEYLFYCLKSKKKKTENINPSLSKNSNDRTTLLSKCAICRIKKSRFIKEKKASELLSSLVMKTPLSQILLFGNILF